MDGILFARFGSCAFATSKTHLPHSSRYGGVLVSGLWHRRSSTTTNGTLKKDVFYTNSQVEPVSTTTQKDEFPLARLPTAGLWRSLLLGYCFSSPRILSLSLKTMTWIVNSKSAFLDVDKNMILRGLLRLTVYNQFCAGDTPAQVRKCISEIKGLGYSGIILGYGKEIVVHGDQAKKLGQGNDAMDDPRIATWLEGNLETLDLIGEGDYMNVKFTGAGETVSKALMNNSPPPPQFLSAMNAICSKARSQNSRIWIDAEQQQFQEAIDAWTIDLMRAHNRDGKALVSNTIQAYLKGSRQNIIRHLQLAQTEGWTLGIKLVRGAYIQQDIRSAIWDTKAETDDNYNAIARDLLSRSFAPFTDKDSFPNVHLFLAGHNKESIRLAASHIRTLALSGESINPVNFGQLHGMSDEIGCELIQQYQDAERKAIAKGEQNMAPRPYKCLNWGPVKDCMHFLMRRAVENSSATDRLKDGLDAIKTELWRRIFGRVRRT